MEEKTSFLHQYVAFQRSYTTLDFDISYNNNGVGRVPGPSDWDIRLVATVPEAELQQWIPTDISPSEQTQPPLWVKTVPTSLDLSTITEWYGEDLGIDRQRCIVVYHNWSN